MGRKKNSTAHNIPHCLFLLRGKYYFSRMTRLKKKYVILIKKYVVFRRKPLFQCQRKLKVFSGRLQNLM